MTLPISKTQGSSPLKTFWHILQSPYLWIMTALLFTVLSRLTRDLMQWTSPLWFIDPLLILSLLIGYWLKERFSFQPLNLSRGQASLVFIGLVWAVAMLYELTLSESLGNVGGFHAKTLPSFILAQGFYIPYAVLSYFLIRIFHFGFRDVFFMAALVSLYEALQFGVLGTLLSPLFFLTPLVLAYYVVVYALMLTLPLVVFDERLLWQGDTKRRLPWWCKVLYSLTLGITCWFIAGVWGELVVRLFGSF